MADVDVPVQQFPILTPGQMSPYLQAFTSGLGAYQDITKSAYLPMQEQAGIASKAAEAAYAPYKYMSAILSNPLAVASMSDDQRKMLLGQFANVPANPMQALNGWFGNNQPGPLSRFANWLSGSSGNQAGASQSDASNVQQMQAGNSYGSGTNQSSSQVPQGTLNSNNASTTTPVTPSTMQSTATTVPGIDLTDPMMNSYHKDFGSPIMNRVMATQNPSIEQKNAYAQQQETIKATAAAKAKIGAKTAQDVVNDANQDSLRGVNLIRNADIFHDAYKNAWIKGPMANLPGADYVAKFDPNAATAQNTSNNMVADMEPLMFGNKSSDFRTKFTASTKLDYKMPEATENEVYNKIKSQGLRATQHQDFVNYAQDQYNASPNKIKSLWFGYNNDVPFYDIPGHKIIDSALTPDAYQNYIDKNLGKNVSAASPANQSSSGQQANTNPAATTSAPAASTQTQSASPASALPVSAGAKMLAKTITIPNFDSPQAYQQWFKNQPKITRDAIRMKLGGQ